MNTHKQPSMKQLLIITILAIASVAVTAAKSKPTQPSVTLEWNLSPDSTVTGYKIYRVEKDTTLAYDAGNTNRYTIPLLKNRTYAFFGTAYNSAGIESEPTETITYEVPR